MSDESNSSKPLAERLLESRDKRKTTGLAKPGVPSRTIWPQSSASVDTPSAAGSQRIAELEQRIDSLELANFMLIGAVTALGALQLLRKHMQMQVKTLVAERILLAANPSHLGAGAASNMGKPMGGGILSRLMPGSGTATAVVSELGVRGGRPELRMLMGRLVLMDGARSTRVQVDPAFTPAPRVAPPSSASAAAEVGMDRMRRWAGQPVVLVNGEGEVPTGVHDARGFHSLRAGTAVRQIDPATGEEIAPSSTPEPSTETIAEPRS